MEQGRELVFCRLPVLRFLTSKTGEHFFPQTMRATWMKTAFTMSFAVLGEDDWARIGKCLSTTVVSIVSTNASTVVMDLLATRLLMSDGRTRLQWSGVGRALTLTFSGEYAAMMTAAPRCLWSFPN